MTHHGCSSGAQVILTSLYKEKPTHPPFRETPNATVRVGHQILSYSFPTLNTKNTPLRPLQSDTCLLLERLHCYYRKRRSLPILSRVQWRSSAIPHIFTHGVVPESRVVLWQERLAEVLGGLLHPTGRRAGSHHSRRRGRHEPVPLLVLLVLDLQTLVLNLTIHIVAIGACIKSSL